LRKILNSIIKHSEEVLEAMIQELLKAFTLIFIAEMGDKTQILAMAFATRFPVKKVLTGIFIGSLLNHGLAVILGRSLANYIPINTLQIVAGFAFVGFSLWTLKSEEDDEEEDEQSLRFGPVLTVAIAFFVGELGDKTQLTAITLASDAMYPVFILGGTVLGMIFTGGLGIIIGKKLGDRIPEFTIKIIASSVFMIFGVSKLYQTLPSEYINFNNMIFFTIIMVVTILFILRPVVLRKQRGQESAFKRRSRELYDYYHQVKENIYRICLGPGSCGECIGNDCIVGITKTLIKNGMEQQDLVSQNTFSPKDISLSKGFDREKVLDSLRLTLMVLKNEPRSSELKNIHEIRKKFETILFNKSIENMDDWEEYRKRLTDIDKNSANRLFQNTNNY